MAVVALAGCAASTPDAPMTTAATAASSTTDPTSTQGYHRAGDRPAPYNVIGNTQALLTRAGTGPTSGDPGFRFGAVPPGGSPAATVSTAWPASRVTFTRDAPSGRYLLTTDGRPEAAADGARVGAATVVAQQVPLHLSDNRDVNGAQTPVVDLVGSGPVTVFPRRAAVARRMVAAQRRLADQLHRRWQPIPVAEGSVWVLLVPTGRRSRSADPQTAGMPVSSVAAAAGTVSRPRPGR